jgi:hypothetical protein
VEWNAEDGGAAILLAYGAAVAVSPGENQGVMAQMLEFADDVERIDGAAPATDDVRIVLVLPDELHLRFLIPSPSARFSWQMGTCRRTGARW